MTDTESGEETRAINGDIHVAKSPGDPEEIDVGKREDQRPWRQHRILKTIAMCASFIYVSITYSLIGPSMVSLEIVLDTSTKYISAGITGNALGYLVGAIGCGFIYKTLNKELLFMVSLLLGGGAFIITAYSWHLVMYIGMMTFHGIFMSVMDTGGQSYILKLWEGHKCSPAMLQTLHMMWAVGATVGPFILEPFLADIHNRNSSSFNHTESSITENISYYNGSVTSIQYPSDDLKVRVLTFRTAFLITAAILFIASLLFLVSFMLGKPSIRDMHRQKEKVKLETQVDSMRLKNNFKLQFLILLALLFFVLLWLETIPGFYLGPFVVSGLGLENNYGSLITSTFWGASLVSYCLGIPASMIFTNNQLIISHLLITLVGFGLLFLVSFHYSIVWIATAVAGFGVATTFGSILLFAEEYIEITGSVSAVAIASSSASGILSPLLTGYLMDQYTHMSLVYLCFGSNLLMILLYLGTLLYCHKFGTRRVLNKEIEIQGTSAKDELHELST